MQHINVDLRQGLVPASCVGGNTGYLATSCPTLVEGDKAKGTLCHAPRGHRHVLYKGVDGSGPLSARNLQVGTGTTGVREHSLGSWPLAQDSTHSDLSTVRDGKEGVDATRIPLSCLFSNIV